MVSRNEFLSDMLAAHTPHDENEAALLERLREFVERNDDCFFRANQTGHITCSAFIVDNAFQSTLLVHHAKLNKWLQPGGHIEDPEGPNLLGEALREVFEETGVQTVVPYSNAIYDVDVHPIPARPGEPAHDHYDIRYLVLADPSEPITISDESNDVRWFPLSELPSLTQSPSMLRLAAKLPQI